MGRRLLASRRAAGRKSACCIAGCDGGHGHEPFCVAEHWRLMGALEALNGMILFGLTTAFLYSIIREVGRVHDEDPTSESSGFFGVFQALRYLCRRKLKNSK